MVEWLFAITDSFIPILILKITHVLYVQDAEFKERMKEATEGLGRQDQRAGIDTETGR